VKYDYDISPEELEQIDRFINQEMSEEEAVSFRQLLLSNRTLQQKVEEVKNLSTGIAEAVLKNSLDKYHQELPPKPAIKKMGKWVPMRAAAWIAASVVFALILGWWLFIKPTKSEELYSRYYKPDPGLMTTMGISDNYVFEKAMVEYKNGDYDKAIEGWNSLLALHPSSDTLHYFLGEAWQASKHFENAIPHLQKVLSKGDSPFYQDASWYLGLIYLRQQETEKARDLLQRSARPESRQLLEALNSK
jgi:tetratricopeptide (TPR) repeat protein